VTSNLARYHRISPFYELLDLPFERGRYRLLRPLLFRGLSADCWTQVSGPVGTFRSIPAGASAVVGIDFSPRMVRAERPRDLSPIPIELRQMDVTKLDFANNTFDAAVTTFLFCVLPDELQVPALQELGTVVTPGGLIRLLEYVRPRGTLRRIVSKIWEPWIAFAYGASFDRQTESHIPAAGLEVAESRYVVDDLVKLICARAARRSN
jgi:SAM-dependent methyltransferase